MAFDHRQRAHSQHGRTGQQTLSQGKLDLQHHFTQRHRLGRRQVTAPHFGVLQHVVEQQPQPQRLGAHPRQVLAGFCWQHAAMVLLDQAAELSDGVDGFAQVMRGHVHELLQTLVGQQQLGLALQRTLLAVAQLGHGGGQHQSRRQRHCQAQVDADGQARAGRHEQAFGQHRPHRHRHQRHQQRHRLQFGQHGRDQQGQAQVDKLKSQPWQDQPNHRHRRHQQQCHARIQQHQPQPCPGLVGQQQSQWQHGHCADRRAQEPALCDLHRHAAQRQRQQGSRHQGRHACR